MTRLYICLHALSANEVNTPLSLTHNIMNELPCRAGSPGVINVSVITSMWVDSPSLLFKPALTPHPQLLWSFARVWWVTVILGLTDGACVSVCLREKVRKRQASHSYPGGPEVYDLFLPGRSCFITWTHQPLHLGYYLCVCVSVVRVSAAPVLSLCTLTCSSRLLFPPFFIQQHFLALLSSTPPPLTRIFLPPSCLPGAACCDVQCWVLPCLRSQQDTHTRASTLTQTHTRAHADPVTLNVFAAG